MSEEYSPAAGWYDDPERALQLRWWDGSRWTTHTRAKTMIEQTPEAVSGVDMSSTAALAVPGVTQPYEFSAPYSWSPSMPSAADATGARPTGTFATRSHRPDELWNSTGNTLEYVPGRSTTPAAWALAVTPAVTVLAQSAAVVLTGLESTPVIWVIGATIIPVLWIIMWVRRDRITLHEWGHLHRAHWGWAFLGDIGYLAARTIIVNRQARGRGWGPLLVILGLMVVLVSFGLSYAPLVGVIGGIVF